MKSFISILSFFVLCSCASAQNVDSENQGGGNNVKNNNGSGGAGGTSSSSSSSNGVGGMSVSSNSSGTVSSSSGVDLQNDPFNCGELGHWCQPVGSNTKSMCQDGKCIFQCLNDFVDCNNKESDGCEINVTNDPQNCGSCYSVCSLPNVNFACQDGKCEFVSCYPNYADCYKDNSVSMLLGCETNLLVGWKVSGKYLDCGQCGVNCDYTSICTDGVCVKK